MELFVKKHPPEAALERLFYVARSAARTGGIQAVTLSTTAGTFTHNFQNSEFPTTLTEHPPFQRQLRRLKRSSLADLNSCSVTLLSKTKDQSFTLCLERGKDRDIMRLHGEANQDPQFVMHVLDALAERYEQVTLGKMPAPASKKDFAKVYNRYRRELEFEDEIANRRFLWAQPAQAVLLGVWASVPATSPTVRFWIALVGATSSVLLWKSIMAASRSWRRYQYQLLLRFESMIAPSDKLRVRPEFPAVHRQGEFGTLPEEEADGGLAERYVPVIFVIAWVGIAGYCTLGTLIELSPYLKKKLESNTLLCYRVLAWFLGVGIATLVSYITLRWARRSSDADWPHLLRSGKKRLDRRRSSRFALDIRDGDT